LYTPRILAPRDQHLLVVFAAVVRHEGFTAAAAELGVTKSVVSAHVRTLEHRLGARLLERTTRSLRLTQLGREVYGRAERIVALGAEVEALVEARHERPVGTLRVAAQTDLGARFVSPVLATLCRRYPELDVEVDYDDRVVDMVSSPTEVAVRFGVPKDSRLIAKKLYADQEVVAAAPALAEAWQVTKPSELRDAPWLVHREVSLRRATFRNADGARSELRVRRRRAAASTVSALVALAREGLGFVVLPELLLKDAVAEGALWRVLPGWRWRRPGVYAVRPSREHAPMRVRVFLDAMAEAMRR